MFNVECPHCKKKLGIYQRKALFLYERCQCVYCGKYFKVKEKSRLANSWFLGTLLGVSMTIFFKASLPVIIIVVLCSSFFLQPFIDILYPLEDAEDDAEYDYK